MPLGESTTLVFQVKSVNHTITLFRTRSQALQGTGLLNKQPLLTLDRQRTPQRRCFRWAYSSVALFLAVFPTVPGRFQHFVFVVIRDQFELEIGKVRHSGP